MSEEKDKPKGIWYSKNFWIIIGLFIVMVSVIIVNLSKFQLEFNTSAPLVVEIAFGVIITLIVFRTTKLSEWKNKETLKTIEKVIEDQDKQYKDIQQDVARSLLGRLGPAKKSLDHSLSLEKKWNDSRNYNFKNSVGSNFDRCHSLANLELNLIDYMKIFGVPIARRYWELLGKFKIKSDEFLYTQGVPSFVVEEEEPDEEYVRFIEHVNDCLTICNELIESLEKLIPKSKKLLDD